MAGLQFPAPGCIVEYFESNTPQIGMVTEEARGRLRLLLPNRRDTKLPSSRILPWTGPVVPGFSSMSRDGIVKALEASAAKRDALAREIPVQELWEMAQGEVTQAPARWFAELFVTDPDEDTVAAYAHALLSAKTRFRFAPPVFEIYSEEDAARRDAEYEAQKRREAILAEGVPFVHALWNAVQHRLPAPQEGTPGYPGPEVAERLERVLRAHMADPESQEEEALWKLLIKGLPEVPHIAVQLLMAWGKIPPHYNFWYDRAGYEPGDTWWKPFADGVRKFADDSAACPLPPCDLPFVSIDGWSTLDIDDAFAITAGPEGGWTLTLALACPGVCWPFGSEFDRAVLHRGTSIYLPEGDSHMMPECISTDALSLVAGKDRPALIVARDVDGNGAPAGECRISVNRVTLAANLRYADCQNVLDGKAGEDCPALPYRETLEMALAFSRARLAWRVSQGAVVIERKEPEIVLSGEGEDTVVDLRPGENARDAQNLVAEMMIIAAASVGDWAAAHGVPMLFRTQDVALPREYAGVWERPEDVTKIMRAMIPSTLETEARPHAALGLQRYAPMTSPLRRYADLINEVQLTEWVLHGKPRFSGEELQQILLPLHIALDGAGQIQRFRPRYWKFLYFRQKGDRVWWHGVITEENDAFVSVSLPEEDIFVRGRRRIFDERACPGMAVDIRLGKVNPLYNEMQILEAVPSEGGTEEDML